MKSILNHMIILHGRSLFALCVASICLDILAVFMFTQAFVLVHKQTVTYTMSFFISFQILEFDYIFWNSTTAVKNAFKDFRLIAYLRYLII